MPGATWIWSRKSAACGWPRRRPGRPKWRISIRRGLPSGIASCWNIGDQIGVVPEVEVWGFSKTLTRLSDAAEVALMVGPSESLRSARHLSLV